MSLVSRWIERATRPVEEIRAEELREWSRGITDVTLIADVQVRTRSRIAGVVSNIRIDPRQGGGTIEATLTDGTGEILARWLGRSSLPGVRLGLPSVPQGLTA